MKSDLQKGVFFIAAGIIGLFLISTLFGINRGFSMMGMMRGMGSGMMGSMMQRNGMMGGMMGDAAGEARFSSNGEKIFHTGVNLKGEAIKNSHGMKGVGCAMCHGADAKGARMMMDVPDIRWATLTSSDGHAHSSGRRHPPYTKESFKTCVIAGIDPAGNQLSTMMPKWEMSKEDLDDLISYLKSK